MGDDRHHERQHPDSFDVFLDEKPTLSAVREVDDTEECVVHHKRKADKRAGGQVFVAKQWSGCRISSVDHEERFSGGRDSSGDALAQSNA